MIPARSLAAQGLALPPVRWDALEASSSARPVAVEAAKSPTRIENAGNIGELGRVVRPQVAQHWMLPYLASLTPQYIESILRQALAGNHQQAWELFDLMLDTSPEIAACTQEFTESVLRKKLIVEPYAEEEEEPSASAIERMKVASAALRALRPAPDCDENNFRDTLRDIVSARWFGTSVLEVDYHTDEDESGWSEPYRIPVKGVGNIIAPRTTFWVHPGCYAWNQEGRLGLRSGMLLNDRKKISQRDYSRADQRGGFGSSRSGMASYPGVASMLGNTGSGILQRFTREKFLIAKHKAKTGSVLGGSVLRPLAWWWCASNFCGDWLLNLAQIWGLPWRKASFAAGVSESDKNDLREFLQQMGSNPWIVHPQGTEVEIIFGQGATGQSPQAFLFELCDRQIRKVILGQTMSGSSGTMGKGGGQAFGEVEADVKSNKIDSAGEDACAVLNEQLVRAVLSLNYGDDSEAPTVRLLDEEEGGVQDAQRDETLSGMGLEIGKDFIRKKYGLPKPRKDEEVLKRAEPEAPASTASTPSTEKGKPAGEKASEPEKDEELEASASARAEAQTPKSSTQLTLTPEQAKPFVEFAATIPDADIYSEKDERGQEEYGRETEPHITVLWGLTNHSPKAAQAIVAKYPDLVAVTFGNLRIFEATRYDVLFVEVTSPDVVALNDALSKLPNEQTHAGYTPHLTLAYLKKGRGKDYVGDGPFFGTRLEFSTVTFSPPRIVREVTGRTELPLSGNSKFEVQNSKLSEALVADLAPVIEMAKIVADDPEKLKQFLAAQPQITRAIKDASLLKRTLTPELEKHFAAALDHGGPVTESQ